MDDPANDNLLVEACGDLLPVVSMQSANENDDPDDTGGVEDEAPRRRIAPESLTYDAATDQWIFTPQYLVRDPATGQWAPEPPPVPAPALDWRLIKWPTTAGLPTFGGLLALSWGAIMLLGYLAR